MLCYIDKTTNPYYNLAAEEYLFKEINEPVFRLWRNSPSVIVGRNQNTLAEINSEFVVKNQIPVVRRLSGGGAVFHDLGNINFTFIDTRISGEDTAQMFRRFTSPIIQALKNLGVNAYLEGRNDLLIDGKKFSGNAICVYKERVLQHGTLLFSSSMANLSEALHNRPEKFRGKSVKSNISRVTNISEHLTKELSVTDFMSYIKEFVISNSYNTKLAEYSEHDNAVISSLCDNKYSTSAWNYGESPKYRFYNSAKFPSGFVEVYLDIEKGKIKNCRIMGDFFFLRPIEELESTLVGTPHRHDDVFSALYNMPNLLSDYIGDVEPALFTMMLCN